MNREARHESRSGRIDCRFAQKDDFSPGVAQQPDIVPHGARDFRIAAQRRQRDDQRSILGRGGELAAKFLVHRFVHTPDEPQLRRTQNGVAVYRFGQVKALSCPIPERAAGLDVPSKKGVYTRSRM